MQPPPESNLLQFHLWRRFILAAREHQHLLVIFTVMITLMAFMYYSLERSRHVMQNIYESQVKSLQISSSLRSQYREVGFRMAVYSAGVIPAAGAKNNLVQLEDSLEDSWSQYLMTLDRNTLPPQISELNDKMIEEIYKNRSFFKELENAYSADNKTKVTEMLEDQWPELQETMMIPLDKIGAFYTQVVKIDYENAMELERNTLVLGVMFFSIGTIFIFMAGQRLKQLHNNFQQQVERNVAASKLASLGEMAGGIAHEINNPLAIILLRSEQLKNMAEAATNINPELLKRSAETIMKTTMRISKIIKGLRSFARNGENDPMSPASLQVVIEETLDFCRAKLKNESVIVELNLPIDAVIVNCRATQISQVVLNLIGNSFDAISKLPEKWIKIELSSLPTHTEISITDSGTGIPAPIREKIMQPFFTTKEVGKGTGLGLSIAQGIVEDHSGKLYIDETASNTRFVIQLPAAQSSTIVSNLAS